VHGIRKAIENIQKGILNVNGSKVDKESPLKINPEITKKRTCPLLKLKEFVDSKLASNEQNAKANGA
jgi:hypothetical protein